MYSLLLNLNINNIKSSHLSKNKEKEIIMYNVTVIQTYRMQIINISKINIQSIENQPFFVW